MDVIQEKRKINSYINDIVKKLKFKNYKINLAGSASLQSQRYFSDYDFNTNILRKYKPITIYNEFLKIISNNDDLLYFLELKIEYLDGTKTKIYDPSIYKIIKNMFKNINYVKIDYVLWFDYHFKELSIIYTFTKTEFDVKDIETDYKELIKEGNYYKALKRLFSIYKITNNKAEAVKLTKFFNSKYGKLYELNSNLKTILLIKDNTRIKDLYDIKQKIDINLKFLKLDPSIDIQKEINKNDIILNAEAKKYLI
jgi:hypothetical protein